MNVSNVTYISVDIISCTYNLLHNSYTIRVLLIFPWVFSPTTEFGSHFVLYGGHKISNRVGIFNIGNLKQFD